MFNGGELFDSNLQFLISRLSDFYTNHYGVFIQTGRSIGAICVLIVVAKEIYPMIMLKKPVDFSPFLRPILIAFVLTNWFVFCDALQAPGKKMEQWSKQLYDIQYVKTNDLYKKRMQKQYNQFEDLQKRDAEARLAKNNLEKDQSWISKIAGSVEVALDTVKNLYLTAINVKASFIMSGIQMVLDFLGSIIFTVTTYIIFFVQQLGLALLIVTGPIVFGLSILPMWQDAWSSWLSRFLSFTLYGFVAYFILAGVMQIFQYGVEVDIKLLTEGGVQNTFLRYFSIAAIHNFVALIIGSYAIKMTPEFVTFIIPTNTSLAAGNFVSGVSASMRKTATTTASAGAGML